MSEFLMMCLEFFKAGLFAIGGGVVTIPFMAEIGANHGWFDAEDVANMIAISDATPGPFGINMATFAGYKAFGIPGSIAAVFSMALPPFIIIILVAKFLDKFGETTVVKRAFKGLRPAVCVMVISAWITIAKVSIINADAMAGSFSPETLFRPLPMLFFVAIFIGCRLAKKVHPVVWIALGALLGLLFL